MGCNRRGTRELLAVGSPGGGASPMNPLGAGGMHKQPLSLLIKTYPEAFQALRLEWAHRTSGGTA